jgi:hypothetical protein
VGDAQANGTVARDWTLDVTTANATGLSSGTLYYFNVLVKDGAGNINAYVSGSQSTPLRTYTTSFPLTESPISEGGNWINGSVVGLDWNNVITTPGLATGQGPSSVTFSDPTALLTGTWGPNQMAQATAYTVNPQDSLFQEVELRLRSNLTAHSCTGYEITFSCRSSGPYTQIVRWNGALGDFTYLSNQFLDGTRLGVANGDVIKATIVGNLISVYRNGALVCTATDNTFTTGSPGIGFDYGGGSTYGDFGLTNFTASELSQ